MDITDAAVLAFLTLLVGAAMNRLTDVLLNHQSNHLVQLGHAPFVNIVILRRLKSCRLAGCTFADKSPLPLNDLRGQKPFDGRTRQTRITIKKEKAEIDSDCKSP